MKKGDKNMVVEKDINGLDFIYENKDELAFEPDPNQLEPIEDEVDDWINYDYRWFKSDNDF